MDVFKPSDTLLIKLGSIIVHFQELTSSSNNHIFDKITLDQLLNDNEVITWMQQMQKLALLPLKRN